MSPLSQAAAAVAERECFAGAPGARLYVKIWTPEAVRGAPILLFHDSLGCTSLWRSFPAALAAVAGREVIAYDRLGFGLSDPRGDKLARDFVVEEGREAAPRLLDALGVDRFVALGHSVGGGMAAEAGAAAGERCEAVVSVSALAFVDERGRMGIRRESAGFRAPGGLRGLARHHGDKARWVLDAWADTWLSPAFDDYNFDAALAACLCPVLALQGDRDDYGGREHPARIAAAARRGRMAMIADCGHFPHREREGLLAASVAGFLAG
jgi:pimeloyl-ACP methyl ester carboxylesterase